MKRIVILTIALIASVTVAEAACPGGSCGVGRRAAVRHSVGRGLARIRPRNWRVFGG